MELLIRRKSNVDSNNTIKDQMLYKKGDIVVINPDGHEWGNREDPTKHPDGVAGCGFVIIKIPGKNPTNAQMVKWLEHQVGIDALTTTKRRIWQVMTDDVPTNILKKLRDDGVATVTWSKIKNYIRNKLTDEREL